MSQESEKTKSPIGDLSASAASDNESDLCYSRISSSLERQQDRISNQAPMISAFDDIKSVCSHESHK